MPCTRPARVATPSGRCRKVQRMSSIIRAGRRLLQAAGVTGESGKSRVMLGGGMFEYSRPALAPEEFRVSETHNAAPRSRHCPRPDRRGCGPQARRRHHRCREAGGRTWRSCDPRHAPRGAQEPGSEPHLASARHRRPRNSGSSSARMTSSGPAPEAEVTGSSQPSLDAPAGSLDERRPPVDGDIGPLLDPAVGPHHPVPGPQRRQALVPRAPAGRSPRRSCRRSARAATAAARHRRDLAVAWGVSLTRHSCGTRRPGPPACPGPRRRRDADRTQPLPPAASLISRRTGPLLLVRSTSMSPSLSTSPNAVPRLTSESSKTAPASPLTSAKRPFPRLRKSWFRW